MIAFVAALALGVAAYLWATRNTLPSRLERAKPRPQAASVQRTASKGWSVTERSCKVLGMPLARLRIYSWLAALVVGMLWWLAVQNLPAGVFMGAIGFQLPGFWIELRAAKALDQLQRQMSVFVGTVNDALHGRGATAEDAMLAAARTVHGGPMAPIAQTYLQRTEAGVAFEDRVRLLGREVDLPSFHFFTDLMQLRERTGVERMAKAFDLMDEKFRDDERMQASVRGELSIYMGMLLGSLAVNVVVFPVTRLTSSGWPLIAAHLGILISLSALGSVVVFSGVRRFARARVMTE